MPKKKPYKITILPDGSCFSVVRMDRVDGFMHRLFDPQVSIKIKSKTKNKNGNSKNKGTKG